MSTLRTRTGLRPTLPAHAAGMATGDPDEPLNLIGSQEVLAEYDARLRRRHERLMQSLAQQRRRGRGKNTAISSTRRPPPAGRPNTTPAVIAVTAPPSSRRGVALRGHIDVGNFHDTGAWPESAPDTSLAADARGGRRAPPPLPQLLEALRARKLVQMQAVAARARDSIRALPVDDFPSRSDGPVSRSFPAHNGSDDFDWGGPVHLPAHLTLLDHEEATSDHGADHDHQWSGGFSHNSPPPERVPGPSDGTTHSTRSLRRSVPTLAEPAVFSSDMIFIPPTNSWRRALPRRASPDPPSRSGDEEPSLAAGPDHSRTQHGFRTTTTFTASTQPTPRSRQAVATSTSSTPTPLAPRQPLRVIESAAAPAAIPAVTPSPPRPRAPISLLPPSWLQIRAAPRLTPNRPCSSRPGALDITPISSDAPSTTRLRLPAPMADRIANARGAHWSAFVETHGMSPQSMVGAVDRLSESIMASMLKTVVREADAVLSEFAETLFGQEMGM